MNGVNWLRELRCSKELTEVAVAEQTGISQQHYNFIENGKRRPSPEVAKRIAAVLGFAWTRFYEEPEESA